MKLNKLYLEWLKARHITEKVVDEFFLGETIQRSLGKCIQIPVYDADKNLLFSKYRRDPIKDDNLKPKYTYDSGAKAALYGWYKAKDYKHILITEGEMDALVAWSANIPAVSSTGGAGTFKEDWAQWLGRKEITICYDNDPAGGGGMARVLQLLPQAKILFLPDRPGVKDISDYVKNGGDLHALLRTAKHFSSLEEIQEDYADRMSLWKSTFFHDAMIKAVQVQKNIVPVKNRSHIKDELERAKAYPIDRLIEFRQNKACCIWHNEKTASLHYYRKENRVFCFGCHKHGDAIDVVRQIENLSFKEAIKRL